MMVAEAGHGTTGVVEEAAAVPTVVPAETPAAKRTKGERRRSAIMEAAAQLFKERGFRATSLEDIGARAGVSGPAIYRYFKSKHELLAVLVEEATIAWRRAVDEVLNEDAVPLVTLEHLLEAAVALQLRDGNLRAMGQQEFRHLEDADRRRLARLDRVSMAEWVHLLREVRPSLDEDEARVGVIMIDGLLRSTASLHSGLAEEDLARVMKEMALGALLALGAPRGARAGRPS